MDVTCSVGIRPFSIVQKCPNNSTVRSSTHSIGGRRDNSRLRLIICRRFAASVPADESSQMIHGLLSPDSTNNPIVLTESLTLWLNRSGTRSRDDCESLCLSMNLVFILL